tara:strand:- start:8663 stop:9664 length:1002 start_codon:yes stop_codon:yes gene_type:complete
MNLLLIYTNQLSINYNKILIIKSFYKNLDLYEKNNIKIDELIIYDISDFNYLDFSKYKNYIFWLHQKIGSYILTIPNYIDLIKKNNIKTIFWMDDLHYPCNNLTNEDRLDKEALNNDFRYNNANLIVSPSIDYFYNVGSKLINKSKFLFYYFDENIINNYNPINFDKRISKILLSGKINNLSYKSRKQIYTNYFNNNQLFDYLEHPGYKKLKHKVYHNNFYNKLSEYKGAILGLGCFPINFLLAKVIEILGSGCIGFFEESELYFKRLNLIENIHYISIKKNENNLVFDNNKFENIISSEFGKQISKNGYNFIKDNFNSKTFSNKIISILYEL